MKFSFLFFFLLMNCLSGNSCGDKTAKKTAEPKPAAQISVLTPLLFLNN